MEEVWKFYKDTRNVTGRGGIKGFVYEVSNLGRVKANGKIIELRKSGNGSLEFGHHYIVYRAVAELFIPNPENKPYIDHIDTNRQNNRVDNLRWVTSKENSNNPLTLKHMRKSAIGFKWITNGIDEKKVKLDEYIPDGWYKGRKTSVKTTLKTNGYIYRKT